MTTVGTVSEQVKARDSVCQNVNGVLPGELLNTKIMAENREELLQKIEEIRQELLRKLEEIWNEETAGETLHQAIGRPEEFRKLGGEVLQQLCKVRHLNILQTDISNLDRKNLS